MKTKQDDDFLAWLRKDLLGLEWDHGNIEKMNSHGGSILIVEEMLNRTFYLAGRIKREGEPRWLLLGSANEKRWALIATKRGSWLRPISFRRQRDVEEKLYEKLKKEEETS